MHPVGVEGLMWFLFSSEQQSEHCKTFIFISEKIALADHLGEGNEWFNSTCYNPLEQPPQLVQPFVLRDWELFKAVLSHCFLFCAQGQGKSR